MATILQKKVSRATLYALLMNGNDNASIKTLTEVAALLKMTIIISKSDSDAAGDSAGLPPPPESSA
jgi:hypothetical protein